MPFNLSVNLPDEQPQIFTLSDGRYRIGSQTECEICIQNDEVARVAATIDIRGEAVFLRNLNPYPIYVGEQELSASQQGEWPVGQTVLLTQSVSLDLHNVQQQAANDLAAQSAKRSRSTMQIAITALCIAGAVLMLASDSSVPDSTKSLNYSFNDLVTELELDKSRKHLTVLNYLIDARVYDVRWGKEDPSRAITQYQLLLDEPQIRDAAADESKLEGRIRKFALARLDDLSIIMSQASR